VRVFLPLAETAWLLAWSLDVTDPGAMPRGSETILVVEDDPRVRRIAVARLRSLGYKLIEADNGTSALAMLADPPDVAMIFTDVVMPGGMSGDELAEGALAARPEVKILFTSGYAEPAIARQGLGANACLKKPYTAAELARKMRDILGERST
jgi:CheY-like chemotaxis protein